MPDLDADLLTLAFVDNGGIVRAKTVPGSRAAYAATAGIGASTTFSVFTALDIIATARGLEVPTGDVRLVADLDAVVVDRRWAWAPADLVDTEGAPWPTCARSFARRMAQAAADAGLRLEMTFESEWHVWNDDGTPAHAGPAYSLEATRAAGGFLRDLVAQIERLGVEVDQVHPEYSPGQLEVSVGRTDPVAAADRVVLVRDAVRNVARDHALRPSFSPKPAIDTLGNGAHLHFSLWRGEHNQFGVGDDPYGLTPDGASFIAGVLAELPALIAIGCGSPVSYLRLGPSRWTGAFGCWGVENREAPIRLIRGSRVTRPDGANAELKTVDASANPYLIIGALIAAGLHGIARGLELPPEFPTDPATMPEPERLARRIVPLPPTLDAATAKLRASDVIRTAMGDLLHDALVGVRRREHADAAGKTDDRLCELYRYRY